MSLLTTTIEIAQKAGELILAQSKKRFTTSKKGTNDLVTSIDTAAEKLIIQEITRRFPKHAILAEESAATTDLSALHKAPYIWLIDPLDGTMNFSHGLPIYAVSIAVFKTKTRTTSRNFEYLDGELVAGTVYAPRFGSLFYAAKGKGAFHNGEKIAVSETAKLKNSLLVTGFPPTHRERNLPHFEAMLYKAQGLRRLGSAALDLCWVADGSLDAFWEFGLKPWDIAAGALILAEAGGTATDTNGNPLDLFSGDLLATNGKIHRELAKEFRQL